MGELWRDLVDVLRRFPVLWFPVLVADLLGYAVNLLVSALLHALLLHQLAQHSVLGGSAVTTPLSASAMHSAAITALLLSWLSNFVRLLLYSGALVATAALVWNLLARRERPSSAVLPTMAKHWGGMLDLSLRALAVYALSAVLFSWFSSAMAKAGHQALLRNAWFGFLLSLIVLTILSTVLPPVALRVLTGRLPDATRTRVARGFCLSLVFVAAVLAAFVTGNTRELAQVSVWARYPLEIIGSLIVALPYVLIFTGMALLARAMRREANVLPAEE